MINFLDATEVRDAYLLPYGSNTRETYTYQLDRWLRWCADRSIEPLDVPGQDVGSGEPG